MKTAVLRDLRSFGFRSPLARAGTLGTNTERPPQPPEPRIDIERTDLKGLRELSRDPEVVAVTPTIQTRLIAPLASEQAMDHAWGVAAVGADTSKFTGEDVIVAVLDTGVDVEHQAFLGLNVEQADFTGSGVGDTQGHGTHCAGTVAGREVNGRRIGVAQGVTTLLAGKVLDNVGGSSEMLFAGMQWAISRGAQVISMSLGFDFPGLVKSWVEESGMPADVATSMALETYRGNLRMFDAIVNLARQWEAFSKGTVIVAAAGNESRRPKYEIATSVPAVADGVISVGAVARGLVGYTVASFSNSLPDLAAPGVDILSARSGGGLVTLDGTSMACPHVAGVAALWWQAVAASDLPEKASIVATKLVAAARTEVFDPAVDVADRGVGLLVAP